MSTPPDIELAFDGPAAAQHELDADIVADSIAGVQRAVRMIASFGAGEWTGDTQRYRPSKRIRDLATIKVAALEEGSLIVPMRVPKADFIPMGLFSDLIDWLGGDDERRPDVASGVLHHLLEASKSWLPTSADLVVKFSLQGAARAPLSVDARARAERLLSEGQIEDLRFIGTVSRAYLDEGQVQLKIPGVRRSIRVDVPKKLRALLNLEPGQHLELVGKFRCDLLGNPLELKAQEHLGLPDLSPLKLAEVDFGGVRLKATRSIDVPVELDEETHQLFVAVEPLIGLHAFAYTREALLDEVQEQLAFLWENYAQANDADLAPDAKAIAAALRSAFKVRR